MRKKSLAVLFGVGAVAVVTAGLAAGVGSAGLSATAKGYKIYLLPKNLGNPYFNASNKGAQKAAKELGDTVTFNAPTEASAAKQVAFIDTAVRQGYNAIIISGNDPNAVAPALKRAEAKGVKVLSYDADVASDARLIYVSLPDLKVGRLSAG